jgi:hypothetical protein
VFEQFLRLTKSMRYAADRVLFERSGYGARIATLRNKFAGQPMLVVGNGPSLNRTPMDDFAGKPSIGMNKIDLLFQRVEWRPSLILALNSLVVKQHAEKMATLDIPVYLSWKSRWMVPQRIRDRFGFFLNRSKVDFSEDVAAGVGVAGTVTYTALQFAFYCGADPVVLVGVDHSFQTDGKPHEYKRRRTEDVNHFHPDYFAKGQYWGNPNLALSERGFSLVRAAYERHGRKVFDATVDGRLQVFDKLDMNTAVALFR